MRRMGKGLRARCIRPLNASSSVGHLPWNIQGFMKSVPDEQRPEGGMQIKAPEGGMQIKA